LSSVIRIDPKLIRFKISPHLDLNETQDGDWDLKRRHPLERAVKYRSIIQRYSGKAWEDTDLFKDIYSRRILTEPIRGEATMKGLLDQYYGRVDGMFEAMKRDGFVVGGKNRLPKLLIGRDGEVFIGNQGNHRLAMAHVLGLEEFAGEVVCRHSLNLDVVA